MPVLVVDYDPSWRERFDMLRRTYSDCLTAGGVHYLAVEHVGSTPVPGLSAKPIIDNDIDIDIVVEERHVTSASAALVSLGFRPFGDLGFRSVGRSASPRFSTRRTHT